MSDLDDLAQAAQQSTHHRPPPVRRAPKNNATLIILVCVLGGGMVLLLVVGIVGASMWTRAASTSGTMGLSVPKSALSPLGVGRNQDEPEFTVGQSLDDSRHPMWDIENRSTSPLTITRMRLNDEFDLVPRGTWLEERYDHPSHKFPIRLTIGETAHLTCEPEFIGIHQAPYTKDVIFIDIDTDRGNFRYRSGEGTSRR